MVQEGAHLIDLSLVDVIGVSLLLSSCDLPLSFGRSLPKVLLVDGVLPVLAIVEFLLLWAAEMHRHLFRSLGAD